MELLNQFAQRLLELPNALIEGILAATDNEDEKAIIRAYATALNVQFNEISQLLIESGERAPLQSQAEVERFIRVSAALDLVEGAKAIAGNIASTAGRIGLFGIFQEIKKIIKFILELLNLPPWLNDLILLLDQIVKNMLGLGSRSMAETLSRMEQNFLAELSELATLKREESYLFDQTDEEN